MLAKALICVSLAVASVSGANLQNSGLNLVQTITVPNWSVGVANTDLFGFNPVTRIMYLADRTNHAVTVIDTHTNTVIGKIPLAANTVVNQPLIAIDLQQLVVSDGKQSVLVWDLVTPTPNAQPDVYLMPLLSGT
jgi:YVTN family beta-propeller protein